MSRYVTIFRKHQNQNMMSSSQKKESEADFWAKIANLKELRKLDLISADEFDKRKQQLIDNMTGTRLETGARQPAPKSMQFKASPHEYKGDSNGSLTPRLQSSTSGLPPLPPTARTFTNTSSAYQRSDSDQARSASNLAQKSSNEPALPMSPPMNLDANVLAAAIFPLPSPDAVVAGLNAIPAPSPAMVSVSSLHSEPLPPLPASHTSQGSATSNNQNPGSSTSAPTSNNNSVQDAKGHSSKRTPRPASGAFVGLGLHPSDSQRQVKSTSEKAATQLKSALPPNSGRREKGAAPGHENEPPRPPPIWSDLPTEQAVRHSFNFMTSKWVQQTIMVNIDRVPFARGSLRYAYYMRDLSMLANPARVERDAIYVAKVSIDPFEERDSYFQDVAMQMYAKEYAKRYNSYGPPKKVDFVAAYVLELVERPGSPLCGVERFIDGAYRKYNSNYGYVSEDERNTPQAFSHFTYEASQHQMLLCDVQGVGDLYTDPQVHTPSGLGYGKGNMGDRGFGKFLATHRCNIICRFLKLPPINPKIDNDAAKGTVPATLFIADKGVSAADLSRFNNSIAFVPDASLYATKKKTQLSEAQVPLLPPLPPDHVPPSVNESQCCCTVS